ncbi:MAG: hypothetical protein RSD74_03410 [Angelakisella sp.]
MKKRILSLLMALCMTVSVVTTTAFATGSGTAAGGKLTTLKQDAVDAVFGSGNASISPGATSITLSNDVEMESHIMLNVDCTLDLNGHTLSGRQYVDYQAPCLIIDNNRTVDIVGSGSVIGGSNPSGQGGYGIDSRTGSSLTIGEGVTVQGGNGSNGKTGGYAIDARGKSLTVYGIVRGGNAGNNDSNYGESGGYGIIARDTPKITIEIKPTGKVYGGDGGDSTFLGKFGGMGSKAIAMEASGVVTVAGGLFGGNGGHGDNGGFANYAYGANNSDSKLILKEGSSIIGGNGGTGTNGKGGSSSGGIGYDVYPADLSKIISVEINGATVRGGNGGAGTTIGGNGGPGVEAKGCIIRIAATDCDLLGGNGGDGTTTGGAGGVGLLGGTGIIKVTDTDFEMLGGTGGSGATNGVDGEKFEGNVVIGEADLNGPEDTSPAPSDNEANTPETAEKIAGAKAGDSVAVKLVSGSADISVSTMNALGAMGKNTNLTLTVSDGLAGGTAEIVIPGGFGKVTEAGRFSYPMNYRNKAEDHDTMVKAVKGSRSDGITYTMRVGANMTLPTAATITLKTPAPHGTALNIYKYDVHANKYVLLGKTTAKDGRLTFSTKEMGQLLFTTGTV